MNKPLIISTSIVREGELSLREINDISNLINQVYLDSEKDFWPQNGQYERTNKKELIGYISKEELIIARRGQEIIGAVHIYPINEKICGFGMLVSSPKMRRIGVGSVLMKRIEDWAKNNNYRTIQLELLKPTDYIHSDKEFLTFWYTKLGYELKSKTTYEDLYPKQAPLLKIPAYFEIYQKNISK